MTAYEAIVLDKTEHDLETLMDRIAHEDTIPARYNRKRAAHESEEFDRTIRAMGKRVPVDLHVGDIIIYTHNDNFGTKKYPDCHDITSVCRVTKITDKQVCNQYDERLSAQRIVAVLRASGRTNTQR